MTRRAFPYTPFTPAVQRPSTLPMDCPDLNYRNHYKEGTRTGELGNTQGDRGHVIPVQIPHDTSAGGPYNGNPQQGLGRGVDGTIPSQTVTGGVVKGYIPNNNTIRKALLVSRNLFSPSSHPNDYNRIMASAVVPPAAVIPSKDIGMPDKLGKRGTGGNYTIPAPQVVPEWPTSVEWLRRGRFS